MKKILVEIIADNYEDAIRIEQAGGNRIELLIDLANGGTTPPIELVEKVCNKLKIPVRVMVRDTYDNYVYDEKIMKSHLDFINKLKNTKADGIVFGSLNKDNTINFEQLEEVIKAKGKLKLTFHRAFDEIDEKNAVAAFKKLQKYKVDTLLTSGTKNSALEGKEIIKKLVSESSSIEILAGKTVTIENVKELINYTNVKSVHVGLAVKEKNKISIEKIKELIENTK